MLNRKLDRIQKTLSKMYGVKIDFENVNEADLREAFAAAQTENARIIAETQFNNYHLDPLYTKHTLIMEAIRMYLREIAPKRIVRKKTTANVVEGANTVSTRNKKAALVAKLNALNEQKEKIAELAKKITSRRKIAETKNSRLSVLLENDLEQAEILLAAKDLCAGLQKMIERVASMQVQDLMPLVDRMRDVFSPEQSTAFDKAVREKLQSSIDNLKQTKDGIENEILRLDGKFDGEIDNDMAKADTPTDAPMDASGDSDIDALGDVDLGGDDMAALDNATTDGPSLDGEPDNFDGAPSASGEHTEPVGRAKKNESINATKAVISESLPSEVQTVLEDLEYYISRRKVTISEAKKAVLSRYKKLRESATDVLVSLPRMSKQLDTYIAENKQRLTRIMSLNTLVMPEKLAEAVSAVGISENDFRAVMTDFFTTNRSRLGEGTVAYRKVVSGLADRAESNPLAVAKWAAKIVEAKNAPEPYRSVVSRLRETKISESKMTRAERDVMTISSLHDAAGITGFAKWYIDNDKKSYAKIVEAVGRVDGAAKLGVLSVLKKFNGVVKEHADAHGQIDDFGMDKLTQLDEEYNKVRNQFETDMASYVASAGKAITE